ncbi:unnamed protein product [Rhizoctonia solani]|uniref:Jacalin-type lectin domain-containing protein n=1 Tax=Rhizoctonia solani TaxID=456999 RepID=A0A8H3HPU4_9AGAM|nr:unnamed protein product [Rhizoctonia solani]
MDNINRPQVSSHQVASYINGATPFIEEIDEVSTEVVMAYNQRESNYAHHGWSIGAIRTISPWTLSRIHATNQENSEGTWVTKRNLVVRCRVQVLLQDLTPVPAFVAAIEEALGRLTRFERFQAVYHALSRWGDVLPLEIEMGSSLVLTDTEANFARFPEPLQNTMANLSMVKTAKMIRKGASNNAGWGDGTWTTMNVPATEWQVIAVTKVISTVDLLAEDMQAQLAELYATRLAYIPPLTIDPIRWLHTMYDDTDNASRTIASVKIRASDYLDGLSLVYSDSVSSISRDSGKGGFAHPHFTLTKGEHITEVLSCFDGEWVRGIQFVTNTGRCSGIYGTLEGIPSVSRSKGGVLAGFSISTKKHPDWDYLVSGIRGIWRHDVLPKIPKENDVYSNYFGARTKHGKGFNDRALIGNSSSMYISNVEVRCGSDIDSIQLTYNDSKNGQNEKIKTARHGGSGGVARQFELKNGEYIVSVSGRYNDQFVTRLCFGTNLGRTSEIYGRENGHDFSVYAPLDEDGKHLRLRYLLGKSSDSRLNGIMFVWTPDMA